MQFVRVLVVIGGVGIVVVIVIGVVAAVVSIIVTTAVFVTVNHVVRCSEGITGVVKADVTLYTTLHLSPFFRFIT